MPNTETLSRSPEKVQNQFEAGFATIASEAHPECNEDAVLFDNDKLIFGVFDGKSGTGQGQSAALFARDFFHEKLSSLPDISDGNLSGTIRSFKEALDEAGDLLAKKMPYGDTTATFFRIFGEDAVYGHIGDSRLYGFKGNLLKPLTKDHGVLLSVRSSFRNKLARKFDQVRFIEDLSDSQNIPIEAFEDDSMQIRHHHRDGIHYQPDFVSEIELFHGRNDVLGSLRSKLTPEVGTFHTRDFSHFLLTSDGIPDNLTGWQISDEIIAHENDPFALAEALCKKGLLMSNTTTIPGVNGEMKVNTRAKRDDMTAEVIIRRQTAAPVYNYIQQTSAQRPQYAA